jgi:hypothetical protein
MNLPDPEQFDFKECTVLGDTAWLIVPKFAGVTWTDENARFRSVLIRQSDHHVISQGFRKFTNFGETPAFEPWSSLWPIEARHKIDGSLLIVSRYKGELIIRTRGSYNYSGMTNADEIPALMEQWPQAFDNNWLNRETYSFLYEWSSPNNVIVLREYEKPRLTLIGIVSHDLARYENQYTLDIVAEKLGLLRPIPIDFKDLIEVRSTVLPWKGKEGIVAYSPCGQILKKFKAAEYLDLHRLAAGLSTIGGVLETYLNAGEYFETVDDFYSHIEKIADFEIASRNRPLIEDVINAYRRVKINRLKALAVVLSVKTTDIPLAEKAKRITANLDSYTRALAFNYLHGRDDQENLIKRAMKTELGIR